MTSYKIENSQDRQHLATQNKNNRIHERGISKIIVRIQFYDQWKARIYFENLPQKIFYDMPFQAFETFCSIYFDTLQSFFREFRPSFNVSWTIFQLMVVQFFSSAVMDHDSRSKGHTI